MPCRRPLIALAILGTLAACSTPGSPRSTRDSAALSDSSPGVEDIYILRSLREERSAPDPFCAASKTGFIARVQDRYSFRAVVTRAPDGKVVDAKAHEAGMLRACFDGVPGAADANFYAEGVIAGIPATGRGRCTEVAADFPEPGITSMRTRPGTRNPRSQQSGCGADADGPALPTRSTWHARSAASGGAYLLSAPECWILRTRKAATAARRTTRSWPRCRRGSTASCGWS